MVSIFPQFDGMILPPFPPMLENPAGRLEAIKNLDTRFDDVILVNYPKSGSHWTWEIICMLLQGKAEYIKKTKVSSFMDGLPDLNVIDQMKSPRVLNTHAPFRWLPLKHIQNGGKLVHVIRNPKDSAVSAFHHMISAYDAESRDDQMQWSDYLNMSMAPVKIYGGWFAYVKEIEEAKMKGQIKSLYDLYYEEMKRNPEKEIHRLAEYLGVKCTDELIKDIADKTSFKKLKEADETIKSKYADLEELKKATTKEQAEKLASVKHPVIYRKGEVGDWKNYFTVNQNEKFDQLFAEEMKNSKLKITFEI